MPRSASAHAADTRRSLKDKTPEYIRGYIGRHIVRILAADEVLFRKSGEVLLSPNMKKALSLLRNYSDEAYT